MIYTIEMLHNKLEKESINDVDWYCTDDSGHIAIIASGGGMLPNSIAEEINSIEIIRYFRSLPQITNKIVLEEAVIDRIKLMSEEQRNNYLRDVNLMVSKGLYYFDKKDLNNYFDFEYFLKAKPGIALTLDKVDNTIRNLITKTSLNINFIQDTRFFVNEIN